MSFNPITRRNFIVLSSSGGVSLLWGCAGAQKAPEAPAAPAGEAWAWKGFEEGPVSAQRPDFDIVTRGSDESHVLRAWARPVPADLDLGSIGTRMETAMTRAGGVGLAGPQVGLSIRVAVLQLNYKEPTPRTIFARNPLITERSDEVIDGYEGCLSVPDVGGMVKRSRWIKVQYLDAKGEHTVEEAEGYNAVLWQHELDHLDGVLYLDRLQGPLLPMAEVRRLRKEADEKARIEEAAAGQPEPSPGKE